MYVDVQLAMSRNNKHVKTRAVYSFECIVSRQCRNKNIFYEYYTEIQHLDKLMRNERMKKIA